MDYQTARDGCHVRSAIYRAAFPSVRYWKNHWRSLDEQVPESAKRATDWMEYDPRDHDEGSLFMFND